VHDGKLGRQHIDGPRGPGALKEKNSYPAVWTRELLLAALEKNTSGAKIVVDLFSGWQSMRPVCEELGLQYIGIDIMGDRNRFIRNAVASTCSSSYSQPGDQDPEAEEASWEECEASWEEYEREYNLEAPVMSDEVKADRGTCGCETKCEPAGSDTAHGSHGFNCNKKYQRWDTARRLKW